MNIFIDSLNNCIVACELQKKRGQTSSFRMQFSYPLNTVSNKVKALTEFLGSDEAKTINKDDQISFILPDDVVFTGCMQFPPFLGRKLNDAFETKFKIWFPNFTEYFIDYSMYERNNLSSFMVYTISKTQQLDELKRVLKGNNLDPKNIEYFSNLLTYDLDAKTNLVSAKLIFGTHSSELVFIKGKQILGRTLIHVGTNLLFDDTVYLDSTYNINSVEAFKYATLHKLNFDTKDEISDEMIERAEIDESFSATKPREVRLLKDESLKNYCMKQLIRKLHSHICDSLEIFGKSPWFFPIREIEVIGDERVLDLLNSVSGDNDIKYVKSNITFESLYNKKVTNNNLFSKTLKQVERRKIDWQKFFSMEIGKKKKA